MAKAERWEKRQRTGALLWADSRVPQIFAAICACLRLIWKYFSQIIRKSTRRGAPDWRMLACAALCRLLVDTGLESLPYV